MASGYSSSNESSCIPQPSSSTPANLSHHDPLSDISQKLADIIHDISRLQSPSGTSSQHAKSQIVAKLHDAVLVRTLRNRLFPQGLFSDPAWDMVLDLTLASIENRQISISSLCIASNAPTTTALRCIKTLVEFGIIEIASDTKDRRRKNVKISQSTLDLMLKLTSAIL
jgi:predicted transcriptional regulator